MAGYPNRKNNRSGLQGHDLNVCPSQKAIANAPRAMELEGTPGITARSGAVPGVFQAGVLPAPFAASSIGSGWPCSSTATITSVAVVTWTCDPSV